MSGETVSKEPTRRASHPFDDSEGSDIIIRASDNVDFYIHRVILSMASPFFKDMFFAQQPASNDGRKPVIDVPEPSRTLEPLLRFCYPVIDPVIVDLTLLGDVLEAAMKYDTTEATLILKNLLRGFIESKPLQVYVISCCLFLEEIASSAAHKWRQTAPQVDGGAVGKGKLVDWEKTTVGASYIEEMSKIPAGTFYRLTEFVRTGVQTSFCEYKKPEPVKLMGLPNRPTKAFPTFMFSSSTSSPGTLPTASAPSPPASTIFSSSARNSGTPPPSASATPIATSSTPTSSATPVTKPGIFTFNPVALPKAPAALFSNLDTTPKASATPVPLFSPSVSSADISPEAFVIPETKFDFTDSDLTIWSSDGVKFRVHDLILRLASPTIAKTVKLDGDGKKSLTLPENSRTVSTLLQGCYPSTTINAGLSMHDISLAISAAAKYDMKNVIDKLKMTLKISTHTEALSAYLIFAQNGLVTDAAEMAHSDLLFFNPLSSLYVPEMEKISAEVYYHLLQYRHRCLSSMLAVGSKYEDSFAKAEELQWWSAIETIHSSSVYLASPVVEKQLRSWQREPGFNMKQLHEESMKLKKEMEDSLSMADSGFRLRLTAYASAPKQISLGQKTPITTLPISL